MDNPTPTHAEEADALRRAANVPTDATIPEGIAVVAEHERLVQLIRELTGADDEGESLVSLMAEIIRRGQGWKERADLAENKLLQIKLILALPGKGFEKFDEIVSLNNEVLKLKEGLHWAWSIIANAGSGNWDLESPEWKEAAEKWRDQSLPLANG